MEKIEELLGRVNATRERLDKVPAILKRFRQAVLAAACTGELTKSDESGFLNTSGQAVPKPDEELISLGQLTDLPANWFVATPDFLRDPKRISRTGS